VPENKRHLLLRTALLLLLQRELAGCVAAIGCEQFVYWNARDPRRCLAPDVFVKLGVEDSIFDSWKCWEPFYPNGRECDEPHGYFCRRAVYHVWPASQSGLVCPGLPTESGAQLRAHVGLGAEDLAGAAVRVCRNGLCATHTFDRFPCYAGVGSVDSSPFPILDWTCEDGRVDLLTATILADPAVLRDDDRYRLDISKAGKILFEAEQRVRYARAWPNGERCDAYPQTTASVDL